VSGPDPWDRGEASHEEIVRFVRGIVTHRLPELSADELVHAFESVPSAQQLAFLACATLPGKWRIDFHPAVNRAIGRVEHAGEVFQSQMALKFLGAPAQEFQRRRDSLSTLLPAGLSPVDAVEAMDRQLHMCQRMVEAHVGFLGEAGFGFDFTRCVVTSKTGGRPRFLVRSLIEEMVAELRRERPRPGRAEVIERITAILGPVFGAEWEDTDTRGLVARTYDNV